MLDSIPVLLQAVLWPLAGAAAVLLLGRLLPDWVRRSLALVAGLACLGSLWSLRSGMVERVEIFWEPLNLFRMSPGLHLARLALPGAIVLAAFVSMAVLGIRGSGAEGTAWRGLILTALAGCLVMAMAPNLVTLAMGSALIDLALVAMALSGGDPVDRTVWRMSVPGIASTLLLVWAALQMDAQVGSASLLSHGFPASVLVTMGVAGVFRLLVFPIHVRGLSTPESAATLLLLMGAGINLLARIQEIAPILANQAWLPVVSGVALLIGGFWAWAASSRSMGASLPDPVRSEKGTGSEVAEAWSGIAIHQAGYALIFVSLLGETVPWPLISLVLALGTIVLGWDGIVHQDTPQRSTWLASLLQPLDLWWSDQRSHVLRRVPILGRWRDGEWVQRGSQVLWVLALASLAGIPLTVGAVGRWPLYAALLRKGEAALLLVVWAADTFLAAALWILLGTELRHPGKRRRGLASLVAMAILAVLLVVLGIVPHRLIESLGLEPLQKPDVSVWGLGLISVLPWLLGAWLARTGRSLASYLDRMRRFLGLGWFYRTSTWAARRLVGAVHWLGQVGEGEGWWGWALVVLAVGIMFLTMR
jgi:hypothetical protein